MLGLTHKIIAERIASKLKLSKNDAELFLSSSIGPDSHGDFPHETGKDRKILYKIDYARTLYLMGDDECFGELGNALHYIQDKWSFNQDETERKFFPLDDELLEKYVVQSCASKEISSEYVSIVNLLIQTRASGLESWFNHSWGFWLKDYASCLYVFADVLELMLPTLYPELYGKTTEELEDFFRTESFRNSIKDGFISSILTNFMEPKLAGYSVAMYSLATINPPSICREAILDLNIAYRLSVEIAKYTLMPKENFCYSDNWTHRTETDRKNNGLAYIFPEYHILIHRPVEEVKDERKRIFEEEQRKFLIEWRMAKGKVSFSKFRSDVWRALLEVLINLLLDQKSN